MNSSGIKRGLAATAVGALAVTGLPFLASTASAVTVNSAVNATPTDTDIVIFSQANDVASVRGDGQDNSVRLEAGADSTASNITFLYQIGGAGPRTVIATVDRNDNGAFSYEWAGAAGLVGTTVTIYAVSTDASGNLVDNTGTLLTDTSGNPVPAGGATSPATLPANSESSSNAGVQIQFAPTVNINAKSDLGVFQAPYAAASGAQYVAINGTTSSVDASADVTLVAPTVTGTPTATADVIAPPTGSSATTGTFGGVLNIKGYVYATDGSADELVVRGTAPTEGTTTGSDDVESFALYRQTITEVKATTKNVGASGGTVTVTVTDQNGNPIAGARVAPSSTITAAPASTGSDITNALGQATFTQTNGTGFYYADATDVAGYQDNLGDKASGEVSISPYVPAATSLAAASHDGPVFDVNEFAAGDLTVQVKDQKGSDLDVNGQELRYYWVVTPFPGSSSTTPVRYPAQSASPNYVSTTAETGGKYNVELPDADSTTTGVQAPSGTYELFASLTASSSTGTGGVASSKVLTFKAGQASIDYDQATEQAVAGSSTDVTGKLALEDGTGLPNRSIRFTYDNTVTGGTDASPDAGIVQASGTTVASTRTVKVGDDGSFSITVRDRSETPQPTENGKLSATTIDSNFITTDAANDGNAAATATDVPVSFVKSVTPGSLAFSGKTAVAGTNVDGNYTPGRPVKYTVTLKDNQDDPATTGVDESNVLANQKVTLTIDHGFFVATDASGSPVMDPKPAAGADAGEYKSAGKSIEVTTNSSGQATFIAAIEDDEAFNDDGLVTSVVTATAGDVTKTQKLEWTSADPLNGGEVRLEFSPANEQDPGNTVPNALPGTEVAFDVYVTDQFGNLVGGEYVTISDNTNDSDIVADDASTGASGMSGTQVLSNFDDDGDFYATSDQEDDQTVTASWTTTTLRYNTAATPVATTGTETLTDSETVNWNNAVITDASVSMTRTPAGTVPVGTAVTETVTVLDDEGNPVPNVDVTFSQVGPGSVNTTQVHKSTNSEGQAFYTFVGAEEGDAYVSAVVDTGSAPVTKTDTVTFGTAGPVYAHMKMQGIDKGKRDVIKLDARDEAAGATVKLFKRKANGSLKQIKTAVMNDAGNFTFRVHDGNGGKFTRYTVKLVGNDAVRPANKSRRVK